MMDQADRDMLIRIDERTGNMADMLKAGTVRMKEIEDTFEDHIEKKHANCGVHKEKINKLEKTTYGTAAAVAMMILYWVWGLITGTPTVPKP